jgi:hypothetical protein
VDGSLLRAHTRRSARKVHPSTATTPLIKYKNQRGNTSNDDVMYFFTLIRGNENGKCSLFCQEQPEQFHALPLLVIPC